MSLLFPGIPQQNPFRVGNVDAVGNRLIQLGNPIDASDAVNLGTVQNLIDPSAAENLVWTPMREALDASSFNIVNLADGINGSDAVTLNQLSNWANYPATSNITFFGNQGNVYDFLGSGCTARGEPAVDVHTSGLRVYGDISSGGEVFISYKDDSNIIQFYDTIKYGTAGLPPSQSGAFYEFKAGSSGPNGPYAYTVRSADSKMTIGNSLTLAESEIDSVAANVPIESYVTRHQTNNILLAAGVQGSLQNSTFFPRLTIPNRFKYVPQVRCIDQNKPGYDRYYPGMKGEHIWLGSGSRGYLTLSHDVNKTITPALFTDPSGFTLYCRWQWPPTQSLGAFPQVFRCTPSVSNETDICNVGVWSNRIGINIVGSVPPYALGAAVEVTGGVPSEASFISSTATGIDLNTLRGRPCNFFLRYNPLTGRFFVSLLLDDLQPILLSTGLFEGELTGSVVTPAQLENVDWRSIILGASMNPWDSLSTATFFQFAVFQNNLEALEDRQAVVTAARASYLPTEAIIQKNIARTTQLVAAAQSSSHNFRVQANGIRPLSSTAGGGITMTVSADFLQTDLSGIRGQQYDYFNRGIANCGVDFQGFTNIGNSNIAGRSWGQVMFGDASNVMVINPLQSGMTNANFVMGTGCSISGFDVTDTSFLRCRDIVVNAGSVDPLPAILVNNAPTGNGTIQLRASTAQTTQMNLGIIFESDATGYSGMQSYIITAGRATDTQNSRGGLILGVQGLGSTANNFSAVAGGAARGGGDCVVLCSDAVIVGSGTPSNNNTTGRILAIARADTQQLGTDLRMLHVDNSGRVFRTDVQSYLSWARISNYTQLLNTSASNLNFFPEIVDLFGTGYSIGNLITNNLITRSTLIVCNFSVSAAALNSVTIFLRVGGVDVANQIVDIGAGSVHNISLSTIRRMNATESIEIRGQVASGPVNITFHRVQINVSEQR